MDEFHIRLQPFTESVCPLAGGAYNVYFKHTNKNVNSTNERQFTSLDRFMAILFRFRWHQRTDYIQ